jgi:hypothetical protein
MTLAIDRRALLGTAILLPALALPGCATVGDLGGGFGIADAIRRLLTLSSQRAFARLAQPDGFFADELVRIGLPDRLGSASGVLSRLVQTAPVRDRLLRQVKPRRRGSRRRGGAVIYDSISSLRFTDAVSILRGGSDAATAFCATRWERRW